MATRSGYGALIAGLFAACARVVVRAGLRRGTLSLVLVLSALAAPAAATSFESWRGSRGAAVVLDDLSGHSRTLYAFPGRVVLLHFFATWCEPCRAEMAALQRLAERYSGHPLTVLAISVAEVKPRVQRFFAVQPVTFPVLLDADRAVARAWDVDTLPTTVVLDRTLTPVTVARGDVDWDRADIDDVVQALLPVASTAPNNKPD
jgi:thiol-disulfide isomerase/thioredoxin